MLAKIRRLLSQFFSKSRTINNEPLNKVSLIVIILIDIFILINVFTGLDDISRWHISPTQAYPCYSEWQNYRTQTTKDKDYEFIKLSLSYDRNNQLSQEQIYQQAEKGHLGKGSATCLKYAEYKDKINNSENQQTLKVIEQKQAKISTLQQANTSIHTQYDSTLLAKTATILLTKIYRTVNIVDISKIPALCNLWSFNFFINIDRAIAFSSQQAIAPSHSPSSTAPKAFSLVF